MHRLLALAVLAGCGGKPAPAPTEPVTRCFRGNAVTPSGSIPVTLRLTYDPRTSVIKEAWTRGIAPGSPEVAQTTVIKLVSGNSYRVEGRGNGELTGAPWRWSSWKEQVSIEDNQLATIEAKLERETLTRTQTIDTLVIGETLYELPCAKL